MALKRELNFLDLFCLASGAMISSGIFILPGLAFARTGPSVVVSYFFAGLLALTGTLSLIELTTALPKAGGTYFIVTRSLGPLVGTVTGLLNWIALILKSAFAIFGIAEILNLTLGLPVQISGLVLTAGFIILNAYGTKFASRLETVLVLILLTLMGAFAVTGFPHVNGTRFIPFAPHGWKAVFATAGFVFVSFGGLLNITSVAEEIKNPKRNIPLALLTSLIVITLGYVALVFTTVGISDPATLKGSMTPISDAARFSMGPFGFWLITAAALLAFFTTAIAGILSASRYPVGLAEDGFIPKIFSRVHSRFGTPLIAILATGLLIVISLFLNLDLLVKAASSVILVSYVLANISILVLRESHIQNYRPSFQAPFYPYLQIISTLCIIALIFNMGYEALETAVGFTVAGIVVYYAYGRKRVQREYALIHLVERIINTRITSHQLENEMREILNQRDEISQDRFDQIVEEAPVLDLDGPLSLDVFLERISPEIAGRLKLSGDHVERLLKEREKESPTAISPDVAVPHIIVDGKDLFQLVVVRCRKGVSFSADHPAVNAVFILIGSPDERTFHLQSLAAIAQIVNNPKFLKLWHQARDTRQLRDLILLSDRRRV
ncbi:MAG: amino acid permease [Candidatus Omnitrophota bacterium]